MGLEEGKKLSLSYCKKVLNSNGGNYSDEQVERIRDILYILGKLDYHIFKEILKEKEDEKGNSVRESIN